ncbi:hypothetical protein M0805_004527, partial [Coniferiporia weirii]
MGTQDGDNINLELYVSSLSILEWGRLCHLAAFTVIIYDIFITMDEEIEFIWKARLSFGKVVFLVNRYFLVFLTIVTTLALFSPNVTSDSTFSSQAVSPNKALTCVFSALTETPYRCTIWEDFQPFATFIIFFTTDLILQMRLYALFERSKKILLVMAIPFVLISTAALIELVFYAIDEQSMCTRTQGNTPLISPSVHTATATPLPGVPNFCIPLHNKHGGTNAYWAEMLFLETLFFVLVCVKTYQSYRDEVLSGLSWRYISMTHVLLRDSFVYFFAVFVMFLANVTVFSLGDGQLQLPLSLFAPMVSGVMGLRLILSIRTNYYASCGHGQKDDFSLSTWQAA